MGRGPENRFIASIHRLLPNELHAEKMHNPYRGGTFDVWYSGNKADIWVEYKYDDNWLSPLQAKWGRGRHAEGRKAIESWGATAIDADGWVESVLELTGGRGADVILELVGAPNFEGNMQAIARLGRLAIVGIGAGQKVELMLRDLMTKRASIFGTTLRARPIEEKADAIQRFHHELGRHVDSGRLNPVIDRSFPWFEAADALAHMEGPGKVGKVLLDFSS